MGHFFFCGAALDLYSHVQTLLNKVLQTVGPVIEAENVECVDVQYLQDQGRWVLRFLLDKTGGITIDDCGRISRMIEPLLDAIPELSESYALEVSSPGLRRPLKKEADFERFAGQRAKVQLSIPLNGQRNFTGILKSCRNGLVELQEENKTVLLPLSSIAKSNLEPDIKI